MTHEYQSIYDTAFAALDALPDVLDPEHLLLYGPGHIVWCDHNWEHAAWAAQQCIDSRQNYQQISDSAMKIIRDSLLAVAEKYDRSGD